MSTQMIVRIDPDLKAKANNFAKSEGKSVSEVVRELYGRPMSETGISDYKDVCLVVNCDCMI